MPMICDAGEWRAEGDARGEARGDARGDANANAEETDESGGRPGLDVPGCKGWPGRERSEERR